MSQLRLEIRRIRILHMSLSGNNNKNISLFILTSCFRGEQLGHHDSDAQRSATLAARFFARRYDAVRGLLFVVRQNSLAREVGDTRELWFNGLW